jgi:23S rRNA (uracil1939-C5)-methyltransferase
MGRVMTGEASDHASEVIIDRLGAQGDGIVETGGAAPLFVPGGLPGERWALAAGGPPRRLCDAPERIEPVCPHFGACGGCKAQHMSAALYRAWKTDIIHTAFAHRGLDVPIAPLRSVAIRSRRRAVFGVRRSGPDVAIGFREEGQHRLVDVTSCVVLVPEVVAALPALREMARLAVPSGVGGRLVVTATATGLDVAFETGKAKLSADARANLAQLAQSAGVARLTVDGDPVALIATPALMFAGVSVALPQNAFVQAVPEAEAILSALVLTGVGKAKRVADLFAGLGTFTFALARRAEVLAVDSDRRAIGALGNAARHAQGLRPITTKIRDLFREPLSAQELKGLDAVVLDPPRAGAKDQSAAIARAKVATVVAVSCNPATLARDIRILVDAGYRVDGVTPVDQFVFSAHLEAVAVLRR